MPRKAWIGVGALVFIGATVAMLPPTKPIGGQTVQASSTTTPMATPPAPLPPILPNERATVPPGAVADEPSVPGGAQSPPPSERSDDRASQPEPRYAEEDRDDDQEADDPAPVAPDIEAAFRAGYQWADHTGTDDRRDCRRWRGSPAEDGCRAKVRERERNRADDDDDPNLR